MQTEFFTHRVQTLSPPNISVTQSGPVVYWMSRDQRIQDNAALLWAQSWAQKNQRPLGIVFCLSPGFLGATWRQYHFLLAGLKELEQTAASHGIALTVLLGEAPDVLPRWLHEVSASALVLDCSPLRLGRSWRTEVRAKVPHLPTFLVDAHNVVPVWHASPKQEYAARTFRPKLLALLPHFLVPFPTLTKQTLSFAVPKPNWDHVTRSLHVDQKVLPVDWCKPGEQAAQKALRSFIRTRLPGYAEHRNDPLAAHTSQLSPYLHFGQLSAHRVALAVQRSHAPQKDKEAFLEELLVRRELAENFCWYQPKYDSLRGAPNWAQKTLEEHRADRREYHYNRDDWDAAHTHDSLWNAAQTELKERGTLHGYLRMYWAKKLLEWSVSPEDALSTGIWLNDRYQLDGRDPNGYVGLLWSIAGLHDRPWFERPVYGTIRYMNANGAAKKFSLHDYVQQFPHS